MGIKQTTPSSAINEYINEGVRRIRAINVRHLQYAGEAATNTARNRAKAGKQYLDQTGNLTSSMGYRVVSEGRIIGGGAFPTVLNGKEGASEGATYAEQLAARVAKHDDTLIMVAGMPYAKYVADRGYDVLDTARTEAVNTIKRLLGK